MFLRPTLLGSTQTLQRTLPVLRSALARNAATTSISLPRQSAVKAGIRMTPPKAPKLSLPTASQFEVSVSPSAARQLANARKLVEHGNKRLYKTPLDAPFVIGSWTVGFILFGGAYILFSLGHYREDDPSGVPWIVKYGHRLTIPVLVFLGYLVIYRTGFRVKTIDLVSRTNGQYPYLLITLRKTYPIPFRKRKQFSKEVTDLVFSPTILEVPAAPVWADKATVKGKPGIGKRISMATYSFFSGTRKIFSGQGLLSVNVKDEGVYTMDLSGDFHNHGRSLLEVASIED